MSTPKLIEHGTRYFYQNFLKSCHNRKRRYYDTITNIGLFTGFLIVCGGWLYWRYTTRPSYDEKKKKEQQVSEYITEKIQKSQKELNQTEQQQRLERASGKEMNPELAHSDTNLITDLPRYESEFEILHHNL